jgi:hypothetical protein
MKRLALGLILLAPVGCLGPGLPPEPPAKPAVESPPPPVTEKDVTVENVNEQAKRLREEMERDMNAPVRVEPVRDRP